CEVDRFYGWGDRVACKKKECVRIGFLKLFLQSHNAGNASASTAVDRGELINVIELQEGDFDRAFSLWSSDAEKRQRGQQSHRQQGTDRQSFVNVHQVSLKSPR